METFATKNWDNVNYIEVRKLYKILEYAKIPSACNQWICKMFLMRHVCFCYTPAYQHFIENIPTSQMNMRKQIRPLNSNGKEKDGLDDYRILTKTNKKTL